jgi:predicted MFS family arabinose efflux permease
MKELYSNFIMMNRNAQISIILEPLFMIPINMFMTYQILYMNRSGLSAEEIGYIVSLNYIITHKNNLILLIIIVLNNFQNILRFTYYNLYLTSYLQIEDKFIALFPGIGAFITLITMYITLPRLSNKDNKKVLLAGMVLFTFSNLVFLFVPPKGFVILLVSIFLGSISMAVIGPYLETCWANSIKNDKRANVDHI